MLIFGFLLGGCSGGIYNNNFNPFGTNGGSDSAIEGRWVDDSGIPSTFNNGIFVTRSGDTNEKLAEGNYAMDGSRLVSIEMRSLVRGTVSRVNCALNGDKLYCTNENNGKFVLTRG